MVSPGLQTHPVFISLTLTCILEMDAPSGWHRHQDESYHSGRGQVEASNIALLPIKVVNKNQYLLLGEMAGINAALKNAGGASLPPLFIWVTNVVLVKPRQTQEDNSGLLTNKEKPQCQPRVPGMISLLDQQNTVSGACYVADDLEIAFFFYFYQKQLLFTGNLQQNTFTSCPRDMVILLCSFTK